MATSWAFRAALVVAACAWAVSKALAGQDDAAAEPPPGPRAVVVLDSAATMLNPLETFRKYYLLRRTFRDQWTTPPVSVGVGLVAYGHRRRSACDDVEVIRQIEPFDGNHFLRAVSSVRPIGQAAVSEGLKAGAELLGSAGGTLLLIAGSADSCQQDPCVTAKALAEANPALAIDVLTVGATDVDGKQLQCIADAARGQVFAATTLADTPKAFAAAFAALAAPPAIIAPAPAPAHPAPGSGLRLSARLGAAGGVLGQPLAWTIRVVEAGKPGAVVFRANAPAVTAQLPAGSYDVEVAGGAVDAHQAAEVAEGGGTDLAVTLGAGSLRLKSTAAKPPGAAEDIFYTVYRTAANTDDDTPDATVMLLREPVAVPLLLPAGSYRIAAARGGVRQERTVDLAAGDQQAAEFALNSGLLQIDADAAADPKAGSPIYFVSEDDPGQPLGRRDVAQSAVPNPNFELPPGLYHVSTRQDAGKVRLDAVVKAGETTRLSVPVSMGRLHLETQGLPGGDMPEDLISYTVERLDEAGKPLSIAARRSSSQAAIELEAGQYRVTGRVGLVNVTATADVAVKAGTETHAVLRQSVGLIDLGYGDVPSAVADVLWEIRAVDGKVVWSTTAAQPLVPLAPGGYTVHVQRLGKDQSVEVELAAGERKTVAIRPE